VYVNGNDNGDGSGAGGSCSCDGGSGSGGGGGGGGGGSGGGGDDDDDEEERKLSTVQELPELTASPPMSLAMCQARERSQAESRHDSDQVMDFPHF